jgi:hypothetical protein
VRKYDDLSDDDDDSEVMDPGVPYLLRVLYDRFWDDADTDKPSEHKHNGSKAAFLFWLMDKFHGFDKKQLCHEAEVLPNVYDQLETMLGEHSGQDIILTLWPIYTMATRTEPTKRINALTISIAFCYDDATTAIVQSQTICSRSDPDDNTPLDDASALLALTSTLDNLVTIVADKGIDEIHTQNNISVASAYFAYNLLGKTAQVFKGALAANLNFLQQFIAGVFSPSPGDKASAFDAADYPDGTFDMNEDFEAQLDEIDDEIDEFFDK